MLRKNFREVFCQSVLQFFVNIAKIILTRCQIFHLKCTKFNFRLGLRPRSRRGAQSTSPKLLAGFWERKGERELERERKRGREGGRGKREGIGRGKKRGGREKERVGEGWLQKEGICSLHVAEGIDSPRWPLDGSYSL